MSDTCEKCGEELTGPHEGDKWCPTCENREKMRTWAQDPDSVQARFAQLPMPDRMVSDLVEWIAEDFSATHLIRTALVLGFLLGTEFEETPRVEVVELPGLGVMFRLPHPGP